MKKRLALTLAALLAVSSFAACGEKNDSDETTKATEKTTEAPKTGDESKDEGDETTKAPDESKDEGDKQPDDVKLEGTLNVYTEYGGGQWDGTTEFNAVLDLFKDANPDVQVNHTGVTADPTKKMEVLDALKGDSGSDVYFWFLGADIAGAEDKLVPISDITSYKSDAFEELDISKFTKSIDGGQYGVPTYGYWEGLFTNKKVVEDAGKTIPTKDTSWSDFTATLDAIKESGKTPIAASLTEEAHYVFEYAVFNQVSDPEQHKIVPVSATDDAGKRWIAGFNLVKELVGAGYFGENWDSIDVDHKNEAIGNNNAAFYIDGAWAAGGFDDTDAGKAGNVTVTYVPGQNGRKATDIIGGLSSGWFITKKAWNSDIKDEAIEFVNFVTSQESVESFGPYSHGRLTVLKDTSEIDDASQLSSPVQQDGVAFKNGATYYAPAVQDSILPAQQDNILKGGLAKVAAGDLSAEELLTETLSLS